LFESFEISEEFHGIGVDAKKKSIIPTSHANKERNADFTRKESSGMCSQKSHEASRCVAFL
jgi:hypothetical protein